MSNPAGGLAELADAVGLGGFGGGAGRDKNLRSEERIGGTEDVAERRSRKTLVQEFIHFLVIKADGGRIRRITKFLGRPAHHRRRLARLVLLKVVEGPGEPIDRHLTAEHGNEILTIAAANAHAGTDATTGAAAEALGGAATHQAGVHGRNRNGRDVGQGDGRRGALRSDARWRLGRRLGVLGLQARLELLGLVASGTTA